MNTTVTDAKTPTVAIELKMESQGKPDMTAADMEQVFKKARQIRDAAAQLDTACTITGTVTVGKQKFKL